MKEAAEMDASRWYDSRLCGCKAHGGSDGRAIALQARRQAAVRRMLNPDDALRHRIAEPDALLAALFADRDQALVDYAAGGGY